MDVQKKYMYVRAVKVARLKHSVLRAKAIKCTKPNGTSIIYENIGEAKKAGYNPSSIRSCICGWRKTHKGCKFEYVSN